MYAKTGRPSIPPEKLLRAQLIQMLYSIRSERLLVASRMRKNPLKQVTPGMF
jgi:transposase